MASTPALTTTDIATLLRYRSSSDLNEKKYTRITALSRRRAAPPVSLQRKSQASVVLGVPLSRRQLGNTSVIRGKRSARSAAMAQASAYHQGTLIVEEEEEAEAEVLSGGGEVEEEEAAVTPQEMWAWNAQTHWRHWHGLWTLYNPLQGPAIVKTYKSVRSLWPVDPERVHLYHRNQWYDATGDGADINWEGGPWAMCLPKHSLPDGILHPNSPDHRVLQFSNGDLGWVQLALKPHDPKSVVFNELHFMTPSLEARMPVIMGYSSDGKLGIALMLEEAMESDKKPPLSWKGNLWKHHTDELESSREEPQGEFSGAEMSLTTSLVKTTRKAKWRGFWGGLSSKGCKEMYVLVHLPNAVTACVPRQPAIGKAHSYYVSWVVDASQIRVLSAVYSADGCLQYFKSGTYFNTSS